jgi:hypothetical protein
MYFDLAFDIPGPVVLAVVDVDIALVALACGWLGPERPDAISIGAADR